MKKKVLIIDDSHLNTSILTDILESEGYKVFSADSGLAATSIAHNIGPDVILLDIIMPEIDGFEVCKQLKDDDYSKDIPIMMVTTKTESEDIKNALELGAFDYIKRPFDKVEIIARIKSLLRLKENEDILRKLALRDGLTGLYNHASFIDLFEKELSKQQRSKRSISFVMIDIDYFKKINDTYGHIVGNKVLKEFSNILLNSVRKSDIISRYGGEEFSMVLPETSKENTLLLCERIRKKIEDFKFNIANKTVKVTISMGVFFKEVGDNKNKYEIIREADEQLYKAKSNGRNRVEIE